MNKELEALLDKLTTKQIAIDLFNIVSNGKYNMNDLVYYFDRIDESLTELEKLKRDMKRYFELEKRLKYISNIATTTFEIVNTKKTYLETLKEMQELEEKFRKVGNE